MAEKWGSRIADDFVGRGVREIGAVFYSDSPIAQATYPSHGRSEPSKEADAPALEADQGSVLAERLAQAKGRDDPGMEDPGMDRG